MVDERSAWLLAAAFVVVAGSGAVVHGRATSTMPGPTTPDRETSTGPHEVDADCELCHVREADEWNDSLHRQAFTDPAFQRAFAADRDPTCQGCHAPQADPSRPPPPEAAHAGVACVTCHVVDGQILSTGTGDDAPHAVRTDARFGTDAACAGCHQFALPPTHERFVAEGIQTTVDEHRGSAYADTSCAGCHMPRVEASDGSTHRSHRFAASRDPAVLRQAVQIAATRPRPDTLELELLPGVVGHAFPTGEMFRRLVVEVEAVDRRGRVIRRDRTVLGRKFALADHDEGPTLVQVADERLGAPGSDGAGARLTFDLGVRARRAALRWRVLYQRAAEPAPGRISGPAIASIELASGRE